MPESVLAPIKADPPHPQTFFFITFRRTPSPPHNLQNIYEKFTRNLRNTFYNDNIKGPDKVDKDTWLSVSKKKTNILAIRIL